MYGNIIAATEELFHSRFSKTTFFYSWLFHMFRIFSTCYLIWHKEVPKASKSQFVFPFICKVALMLTNIVELERRPW